MEIWYSNNEEEIKKYKYLVMLDLEEEELKKISKKDRMVTKYMEEINKLNEDPIFREYMTKEQDDEKIFNTEMHKARDEGMKEGIKQGIKEGMIKVALNLKLLDTPFDIISKSTGLSIEAIENL